MLALIAGAASAQIQINSSPNIVGSGARALGMGGAFVAVADDATAASWNPGGLTQLERPELSLVYSWKWRSEDFSSEFHPEMDGGNSVDFSDVNYLSFVYPIPKTIGGRNLILSLNYQRKYDFDRDLNFRYRDISAFTGGIGSFNTKVNYSQRGQLATLSPAFGFEITDRLSVGAVINIWDESILPDNEWKVRQEERRVVRINGMTLPVSWSKLRVEENYDNFKGVNSTWGILYKPTEHLSIGAVYTTKFNADVDYSRVVRTNTMFAFPGYTKYSTDYTITFPSAIGLGVAYRFPNDKLTLSFDVTRREWDQFILYDDHNPSISMHRVSGVTGLPKYLSSVDPTYTFRLGAEYVFVNPNKPEQNLLPSLRAGIFYDPEPAGGRRETWYGLGKVTGNVDDYYGFTLGAGILIHNRVNLDIAYQYRWGDNVRKDTFNMAGTDADVDQHTIYLSTVIYF